MGAFHRDRRWRRRKGGKEAYERRVCMRRKRTMKAEREEFEMKEETTLARW
jgi:TATA-binding protein-associated factor Taf7